MAFRQLTIKLTEETRCTFVDIFRYPDESEVALTEGSLDNESLDEWFLKACEIASEILAASVDFKQHQERPPPEATEIDEEASQPSPIAGKSDTEKKIPSSGFRLLVAKCGGMGPDDPDTGLIPIRKQSYDTITEALGFPKWWNRFVIDSVMTARALKIMSKNPQGDPVTCFLYTLGPPGDFFRLLLSHNPKSGLTHAILLTMCGDNCEEIKCPCGQACILKLLSNLKTHSELCSQPLLIAALTSEVIVNASDSYITRTDGILNNLELRMGQHDFNNRPRANPLELNFIEATRALNASSKDLAAEGMRLGSVRVALDLILFSTREIEKSAQREPEESDAVVETMARIEEIIAYLNNACQVNLLRIEYETKRAQTLIAVVYQFMAQKDTKLNIQLAESSAAIARASKEDSAVMRTIAIESKKDSTAMKTIAVLGMLFLPGTFVAAIFAMPVFNWDGPKGPVINVGFKYFWAAAAPLTFLVMVLWLLIMMLPWRSWIKKGKRRWWNWRRKEDSDMELSRTTSTSSWLSR